VKRAAGYIVLEGRMSREAVIGNHACGAAPLCWPSSPWLERRRGQSPRQPLWQQPRHSRHLGRGVEGEN